MLLLGGAAWAGVLLGHGLGWWALAVAALGAVGWAVPRRSRSAAGFVLVLAGAACVTVVRADGVATSRVARLAGERAAVRVVGTVTADPRRRAGRYGDVVITRLDVREVTRRGATYALAAPVLVLGDEDWADVALGSTVEVSGRLSPADGDDLAAVLGARGPPAVRDDPDLWWDAAA